jgi:hypothetical protein
MFGAVVEGAAFSQKSMQSNWSTLQIERQLVLPKGWMTLQFSLDSKYSTSQRDTTGQKIAFDNNAAWSYSRFWFNYANAFSKTTTMYIKVPIVRASLRPDSGATITTIALGDVHSGIIYQPKLHHKHALAAQLDLKSPSGVEWPGNRRGGPSDISSFLTGTGITNLGLLVHGKMWMGQRYAIHLAMGYIVKFPGIVGYVVEQDGFGNGILSPGNEIKVDAEHIVQLSDDFCLQVNHSVSQRAAYKMGVSGEGISWNVNQVIVEPSLFVDAGAGISWEPNPKRELVLSATHQIYGSQTVAFSALGLEEFFPQPGTTVALKGAVRW